jgi:hypothetical protein
VAIAETELAFAGMAGAIAEAEAAIRAAAPAIAGPAALTAERAAGIAVIDTDAIAGSEGEAVAEKEASSGQSPRGSHGHGEDGGDRWESGCSEQCIDREWIATSEERRLSGGAQPERT